MNLDTITLKFQSVVSKMKSDLSDTINKYQKLDSSIEKVSNSMNKMTNTASNIGNSFKNSTQQIEELEKELKDLTSTYSAYSKVWKEQKLAGSKQAVYNPTEGTAKFDPNAITIVTQEKLDEQKARIDELKQKIEELTGIGKNEGESSLTNNIENGLKKDNNESTSLIAKLREIAKLRKGDNQGNDQDTPKPKNSNFFDDIKDKFKSLDFKNFGKNLSNSLDGGINKVKKLALGLIGVRTAMSVLTKSVNAYLSFDSTLQESLTNSWNTLGALLAPAIELVARLFAMATTYVAQFVSALTGIDLVARANAKALDTQAKANQKANNAQRGLLSMDEITNLPTESATTPASQIQIDDTIKSFKLLDDLVAHLKGGKWHLVGEDIAHAIDDLLGKIDWKKLKENAYNLGYNFGDFLNGLFEVNWGQIGRTIAETFNTFTQLVKGFVEKFSFNEFAMGITNMINGLFLNIEWDEASKTINEAVQKIGDSVSLFLMNIKWGDIGSQFGEFVASIDWGNILFQAIKISLLATLGVGSFIINFFAKIFEGVGNFIGDQVYDSLTTIGDGIDSFFSWLEQVIPELLDKFGKWLDDKSLAISKGISSFLLWVSDAITSGVRFIGNIIINFFNAGIIDPLNTLLTPIRGAITMLGKVAGKNWSLKDVKIPHVPALATGTPNIESEGLYHLHEGEMVVPKRYNPNTDGYDGGSDNQRIIDLLIALNSSMLEYADRPINISMNGRQVAEATYDSLQEIDKSKNHSNVVVRS